MKMIKFAYKYIFEYKFLFVVYILINLMAGLISLILPVVLAKFIDDLILIKEYKIIIDYSLLIVLIGFFNIIIGYVSSIINVKMKTKTIFNLEKDIYKYLQNSSVLSNVIKDATYLNQRISTDADAVLSFSIELLGNLIINTVAFSLAVILLVKINIKILLLLIVLLLLYGIIYYKFKNPIYKLGYELKENQSDFFSKSTEQISNIKFMKMHSVNIFFHNRLEVAFAKLFNNIIKMQKLSYAYYSCDSILYILQQVILFLFGGFQVVKGNMTIGMFIIISQYFDIMMKSLKYFFNIGETYQDILASYDRIEKIFNKPMEKNGNIKLNDINKIELEDVNFKYDTNNHVFKYNCKLEKGNIYCIKGKNGAGKSTFVNLILGLYNNKYEGTIKINDVNINELDMITLRMKKIGITEQEPLLVNDTLYNNLFVDVNEEGKLEEINMLSELLGIKKYIEKLSDGMNTVINDKTDNISGGEKQKISLIRTLVNNPDVMIFDEPTSAMDCNSKDKFLDYISKLSRNKIIIIISHDENVEKYSKFVLNI